MKISTHGAIARLHKTAGVIVAPFLILAALTGFLYALAPSIEQVVYRDTLQATAQGPVRELDKQVRAARFVHPDLPVAKVQVPADPSLATAVVFRDADFGPSYGRAVYIDPHDLHVTGEEIQYGSSRALPLRSFLSEGHRSLWLGEPGRIYSELAASWMGALALLGIYLLLKRRKAGSGARKWHGRLGAWLLPGLLFLTITGLTWSLVAGAGIGKLREEMDWMRPTPATTIASAADGGQMPDVHAEHRHGHGAMSLFGAQKVLDTARREGLSGMVELTPPEAEGEAWVAAEAREAYRLDLDSVSVDPSTGEVVESVDFAQWPTAAKLTEWLINLHMGFLFGLPNQIALAVIALGLLVITVLGLRMWFTRPSKALAQIRFSPALLVAVVAYSVLAPLFGASLLLIAAGDWAVRRWRAPRSAT